MMVPRAHLSPPAGKRPPPYLPRGGATSNPPALQPSSPPILQPSSRGVLPATLGPAARTHRTALSRCSGPPEAPGQPPGRSAAPRGCGGGKARRAPGPRPVPRSEAPRARDRTPASGCPDSTTSRWVLHGPGRIPPGCPLPGAPRSSPAAGQGASAAAAGDAFGAASAATGRAPRPRQGQPLARPRPSPRQPLATTSPSSPPPLPVVGRPVTQRRNGAIYFSPALFPCIGVAARGWSTAATSGWNPPA